MERVELGATGLVVSRFCFGTLPMGPLQAGLPEDDCVRLLERALELGVNFFDTAELYRTYPALRRALAGRDGTVVATKSYAYDGPDMARAVEAARRELDREVVDIVLLHEQESARTLAGHRRALDRLVAERERGRVRAAGVSTHSVEVVRAAAELPEVDVIHPLVNLAGVGIRGGARADMEAAIARAAALGKGIYVMKALAGGHLYAQARAALAYAARLPGVHAVAVGVKSPAELMVDVAYVNGEEACPSLVNELGSTERRLFVESWCRGCGRCVSACPAEALSVSVGRVEVDAGRCLLCGYCAAACPEFCLKVV